MKAAVYHGKENITIDTVPDPKLEDGEVLLSIDACSVCGTDLRTFRHGDPKIEPPRILGHEFCARVVENRSADSSLKPGQRVVMYIVIYHQTDRYIEMGRSNLSNHRTTMSYHHDGAFAPLMKVPAIAAQQGTIIPINTEISSEHMSLAEPIGCCVNAHSRLGIGIGDTVAVLGAGPIGMIHATLARLQGASKVFVLDINAERLDRAKSFDIDAAIQVQPDGSHHETLRALTNGIGANVVIVANGSAPAQNDALEMVAKAGKVNFFAGLPKSKPEVPLNVNHIHYKEIEVSGSYSERKSDYQRACALLASGRFPAEKMITHTLPLERFSEAFPLMESGEALKVCVLPNA